MSYNFLVNATKNRIISELKAVFANHPHFKDLEILNKFPYAERIQQGILVRNTTASRMALAADNFQGTVCSYTAVANHLNSKSLSVEWVREDSTHLSQWISKDDFSNQFKNLPQLNRTIKLRTEMVKSHLDLGYATDIQSVEVFINGQKVIPALVDGERCEILLSNPPATNSTVLVSYWYRNLAAPGIYQLEITGGDPATYEYEFMLDALLEKEETLIHQSTGKETTVSLAYPVFNGSLKLRENDSLLNEGEDYILDNQTGIITFLSITPLLKGSKVSATYRTKGLSTGPFIIPTYNQANNKALPGVVIAFGRGVSIGDKHFILVTKNREVVAQEFSGKWNVNISLDIYAKDSHMIEEIIDITTSSLLFHRKDQLDEEGLALVDVGFSGESEQIFDEATGDMYYTGSVSYDFLSEWILHKPLLRSIEGFDINTEVLNIEEIETIFPGKNKNFETIK